MIAEFLYRNPRLLALLLGVITVGGVSSGYLLPRLEDPVLRKRVGIVDAVYPGANAEKIESAVVIPLENTLAGIPEIKQLRSHSRANAATLVLELDDMVHDVDEVWSAVRRRLTDAEHDLPAACSRPQLNVFPLKAYAAILAVKGRTGSSSPGSSARLIIQRRIAGQLRSQILALPGTESAQLFGDPGEEIVVSVTPETLTATGLSTAALAQQIVSGQSDQPGGSLAVGDAELLLDLDVPPLPTDQIGDVLISYGGLGDRVPLSQIAEVRKRLGEPTERALIDGSDAVVLGVMVEDNMRVDQWSQRLENTLQAVQQECPDGISVEVLFSQSDHIRRRMETLKRNLVMSTAAVILVVMLLMGWRSMMVVAAALPLSAMMVLSGMRWLSIPIHQMSVTGLIVALGLLIDNAIVIVEDVRSRIYDGVAVVAAIRASVRHFFMPLFGSTLTTALAFLPIATLPGPAGEFVGSIATSVILAIASSFLLSMTVVPALIGLLRIDPGRRSWLDYGLKSTAIERAYRASLVFVFRFPLLGVLLGLGLPASGYWVAGQLPEQFFPPSDRRQIQVEIERPARDTIASLEPTVERVRELLQQDERIGAQNWFLGGSAPTFYYNVVPRRRGTSFYAQAFIEVRPGAAMAQIVQDLQEELDAQIFDSRVLVRQLEQGPPFDAPIEIRVVGDEMARLQEISEQLRGILCTLPQVTHTRADVSDAVPKLTLDVDSLALQGAGLSHTELSQHLYTTLHGADAGAAFDGGQELPVRVALDFGRRSALQVLRGLIVPAREGPVMPPQSLDARGGPVGGAMPPPPPPLGSLATFSLDSDASAIVRVDGRRVSEIKAYVRAGVLPSVVTKAFHEQLKRSQLTLPAGYALELGGEAEQRTQAVDNLIANAVVLFALMLLTLVTVFRSFRSAWLIAVVGSLSVGLGPLALHLFGFPFGFMAIVGTMGLIGVAINDSIVVLAAIKSAGPSARDPTALADIVFGCTRHILATTLTTIAGFMPLVLGGGGFWPPPAVTIAGGVGGATVLALYFVPSLDRLLHPSRH